MSQEHHEKVVWHIVIVSDSLLLLREVVGEGRLKVGGAGGENDLVAIDWLSFDH